jgi:hypothetical protein
MFRIAGMKQSKGIVRLLGNVLKQKGSTSLFLDVKRSKNTLNIHEVARLVMFI